jgi:hypothetical protein
MNYLREHEITVAPGTSDEAVFRQVAAHRQAQARQAGTQPGRMGSQLLSEMEASLSDAETSLLRNVFEANARKYSFEEVYRPEKNYHQGSQSKKR